ncbi:helix-turn-helix domain-containing protein [Streptomyces sp. NPDC059740]|uniref:helix-turn-helix domain-containing protein n=1 Tax=Streptomyces sp. NPDC059740 TaxID=3346926 RepID=UPI003657D8F7
MSKSHRPDPTLTPRALYGAELRYQREQAGLSQAELGAPMFVSGSFIGQLESGARRMQREYAEQIDEILRTDGFFARHLATATTSRLPEHVAQAAESESLAKTIREYAPQLVPGLLQTEEYTRAVLRAADPVAAESLVEEMVAARLERAGVLEDPTTPLFWAVLDEAVLRRPVGGPAVMAGQLAHILTLAQESRIIVQVLPFAEGAHAGLEGALKLMTFTEAPPVVHLQGPGSDKFLDDPVQVERYSLTYDLVRAAALSPEASLTLVESAAEGYRLGR